MSQKMKNKPSKDKCIINGKEKTIYDINFLATNNIELFFYLFFIIKVFIFTIRFQIVEQYSISECNEVVEGLTD